MAKKIGRPTLYKPDEMIPRVLEWVKQGIVDEEIATGLGINAATLYAWKNRYVEFSKAFKKGHEYRVNNVVNSLYKRAVGYSAEDKVVEEDGDGNIKSIKTTQKHIAGDTTAQQVFLYNKAPEAWKSRNHGASISLTQNNINIDAAKEQVQQLLQEYQKAMQVTAIDCTPEQLKE